MSEPVGNDGDHLLASLLVAYDEALRRRTLGFDVEESIVAENPPLASRYRAAKGCLEMLDRVRRFEDGELDPATPLEEPATHDDISAWPETIGRFRVERELGRGGLGVVLLARDPQLNRQVAIKIQRSEIVGRGEAARRFVREAEAAARLNHPHLVPLYELGQEQSQYYLVSEYCPGPTLAQWLMANPGPLPPRRAARIVQQLADGVHHAHSRGVLHRDIKPSNVMLARQVSESRNASRPSTRSNEQSTDRIEGPEHAGKGRDDTHADDDFHPKLTDFGLAKLVESVGEETRSGAIIGTPAFMAPEQADGRVREVDARTDVYALGAVLYQLLTGRPPFLGASDVDTLRQLCLSEPEAPRRLCPAIPRDLEAITLRCLAKESQRRYPTAQHLSDDLTRFLTGQPTEARPLASIDRLGKWVRRRPAIAALWGVVLAAGIALMATIATYNVRLQGEVARADAALDSAQREAATSRRLLYAGDVRLAHEALRVHNAAQAIERLRRHGPRPGQEDLREFTWHYLRDQCDPDTLILRGHTGPVMSAAYSPDGKLLATGGDDSTARIWDASSGEALRVLRDDTKEVNCVAFSPDGRVLAAAHENGAIRLWNPQTGAMGRALQGHRDQVLSVAFSLDGRWLASGGVDRTVRIWDIDSGVLVETLADELAEVRGVAFSPEGDLLYAVDEGGSIHVWRTADWQRIDKTTLWTEKLFALAVSGSGTRIAVAGRDEVVSLWHLEGGQLALLGELTGHNQWIMALAFSPDNTTLASADHEGVIQLQSPDRRFPVRRLLGHGVRVWCLAFSPDGRHLASGGKDCVVRIWPISPTGAGDYPPVPARIRSARFSTDGTRLYSGDVNGGIQVWDVARRSLIATPPMNGVAVDRIRVSPDDSMIATWKGREIAVWSSKTLKPIFRASVSDGIGLDFSPCGRWLAHLVEGNAVALVDLTSWKTLLQFPHDAELHNVLFTPDGQRLITVSQDVRVWNTGSGELQRVIPVTGSNLAVSEDGRVVAAGASPNVTLIDIELGRTIAELASIGSENSEVAIHGDTVAVATEPPPTVCLWDLRTHQELARLEIETKRVDSISFSADGTRLIATGVDRLNQGRIWEWVIHQRD